MKILFDKRGEKWLSIWWFAILALVATSIAVGVYLFYGVDIDVRGIESEILYDKIIDCAYNNGFFEKGFLSQNNIFDVCGLNKNLFGKGSDFFVKISFVDVSGGNLIEDIKIGDYSFESDCVIQQPNDEGKKVVVKNYPVCIDGERKINYFDKGVQSGSLKVMAASNQEGARK